MANFKIVLAFMAIALLAIAAIFGCGEIKSYPTSAVESGSGSLWIKQLTRLNHTMV